jgi:hypothetical protein
MRASPLPALPRRRGRVVEVPQIMAVSATLWLGPIHQRGRPSWCCVVCAWHSPASRDWANGLRCSHSSRSAGEVLGRTSPEYIALALRAASPAGALSLREICRERIGWHRTRSELYRFSDSGAARVAAALQADGIQVPDGLR